MSNGRMGYGLKPGEYSKTSIENKITIPWRTYLMIGLIGTITILCWFFAAWFIWLLVKLNQGTSFWRWASRGWWPWLSTWWPIIPLVIILWWGSVPAVPTLWRFIIEQFFEWLPPTYQPVDLDKGGPWPLRNRKKSRYDEFYNNHSK